MPWRRKDSCDRPHNPDIARIGRADPALPDEYRARCLTVGKRVLVVCGGESRPALALGVNEDFSLAVRYDDGTAAAVRSGEVTIR